MNTPICIHDEAHDARRTSDDYDWRRLFPPSPSTTEVRCQRCAVILYEIQRPTDPAIPIRRIIYDDVYKLYYTREGRLTLVVEALQARGMPIPEIWRLP